MLRKWLEDWFKVKLACRKFNREYKNLDKRWSKLVYFFQYIEWNFKLNPIFLKYFIKILNYLKGKTNGYPKSINLCNILRNFL